MAISYADTLRKNRMDEVNAYIGNTCYIRIMDGTRPANEGAETNVLADLRGNTPFGVSAAGLLTAGAITPDTNAPFLGTNTATWFRILKTDDATIVMDGSVGTVGSGADLELDSTSITQTQTVSIDTFIITEGNDFAG